MPLFLWGVLTGYGIIDVWRKPTIPTPTQTHTTMPNMSYCRFHNTANDLADCLENIHEDLSESEQAARKRLIAIAREIVAETEGEDTEEDNG